MKTINTAIVTALLAMGIAGNATASPRQSDTIVLKQMSYQGGHKAAKKVTTYKRGQQKRVVKRIAKKRSYKESSNRLSRKQTYTKTKRLKRFVNKRANNKHLSKRTYRVRSGDTLTRIAARNHVSLQKLIKINKLWGNKANNLHIGMIIRLA